MVKPNVKLLKQIALAMASGQKFYISQQDGLPLLQNDPALIEVDKQDIQNEKAACWLTAAGKAMATPNTKTAAVSATPVAGAGFAIITNAVLPASKRGSGLRSAEKKYPFDQLEVNGTFFVAANADYDPVKKLGSAVSAANMRYSEKTGETEEVERTKRGPKNRAVLDANGAKVKETVTIAKRKPVRKFAIRPVKGGEKYGEWVAPSDGALIGRIL